MADIEALRKALSLMNLSVVARGSGVHVNALHRFVRGQSMPRFNTMQKVVDFLKVQGVCVG